MAGEGDAERLVVLLEARIRDFEKNMAKASGTATKSYSGMRRDSQTATQRMEADMVKSTTSINRALTATSSKIGGFGKSLVAGFAGGLIAGGVAGIVSQIGQIASGVAAVGDEAKRAGVSVEAFQELKFVAEQNRIGVDSLTDGLKELNLRADEFIITGGGSAAEAFARLGYNATELKEKLNDPSALFTEIIGKLGQLDKAAQIRVADELFGGTGGEKFVQLIDQGEAGIRRTIQSARDLGLVMDSDMIAKAAEVDRQFNAIANTVGTGLKSAIVDASFALQQFIDKFNATQNQQTSTLNQRMRDLGKERVGLELDIHNLSSKQGRGGIAGGGASVQLNAATARMDQLLVEETAILQALEDRTTIKVTPTPLPPPPPPKTPGDKAAGKAAGDAEREAKAIQNLIAGLEFEKSLIGLSAIEQEKMNALRQAGAGATDEQRARISQLTEAIYSERLAADQAAEAMQQLQDIGVGAAQSLADAFADGKIEGGELLNIVMDIVKQLLTMPAPGGGGGNWLGSLLGIGASALGGAAGGGSWNIPTGFQAGGFYPGLATGGTVGRGGMSWVGEDGPELLKLPRGAEVFNNRQSQAMANDSQPSGSNFSPTFHINGSGLSQAEMKQAITEALDSFKRFEAPQMIRHHANTSMAENG